jgi:putative salt-induced outer membrane protein YdiY
MKKIFMQARIVSVGLSALLLVTCSAAWAQTNVPLVQVVPPAGPPVWHGTVAAGLSLARGNANTFLMNASASAENVWDQNDLKLGADGQYGINNFGTSSHSNNVNQLHGVVDYKRLITERFYFDGNVDGFHDDIAKIRYRVIVGPAAGYYLIKSDATKFNAEVGPSWVKERLEGDNIDYWTIRFTERYEHAFNKGSKIWEQVDYLPAVDDFQKNYLLNSEAGVEAALNSRFSLRLVGTDKYNSEPAAGAKPNDVTLVSSLVYKY